MIPFRISRRADADMDARWEYVARHSPAAANRWIQMVRDKFRFLSKHPETGELCPELGAGVRRFAAGNHGIYYRLHEDHLEIVRVVHAARDVDTAFGE